MHIVQNLHNSRRAEFLATFTVPISSLLQDVNDDPVKPADLNCITLQKFNNISATEY